MGEKERELDVESILINVYVLLLLYGNHAFGQV